MNTNVVVSDIRYDVANTHTIVSDIQQSVSDTQAIVTDIHRTIVASQEGTDWKTRSVSVNRTLFIAESTFTPFPRLKSGQLSPMP